MARNEIEERHMRRRWRKTVYVIPSLITTANIFCGFYSIMESLLGVQSLSVGQVGAATEHFNRAALNIGFATLFDFLDGSIARLTRATSEFGIELDLGTRRHEAEGFDEPFDIRVGDFDAFQAEAARDFRMSGGEFAGHFAHEGQLATVVIEKS